jgi:hypothetical protein
MQIDRVQRFYVRFVCSNGRIRYCGPDGHMPYQAQAAELYATPDEAYERMESIPRTHLMKHTTPELMARKVVVPHVPTPAPRVPTWDLPGLRHHG